MYRAKSGSFVDGMGLSPVLLYQRQSNFNSATVSFLRIFSKCFFSAALSDSNFFRANVFVFLQNLSNLALLIALTSFFSLR